MMSKEEKMIMDYNKFRLTVVVLAIFVLFMAFVTVNWHK